MDTDEPSYEVEDTKEVGEYLAALRRYKGQILGVAAVVAAISFLVAIVLPPVFRSSATILVQEQEVPPDLVRSTITSFADERIQVISQQVMTRVVLLQIINKYGLYQKYRGRATDEEILDRMRRDIKLSTVNADISDRSSGRRVNATIAFKISYDAPDPEPAVQVANELVSLYLNENVKARQQSVAETTAFLAQEAERLGKQVQSIEANLADFKRRNVGRMPDSSAINVQLADRTEADVQRVERETSLLQDRKRSLEVQLSLITPNNPVAGAGAAAERTSTPEERRRALQTQYLSVSSKYGPEHPDVRRLKREIAALDAQIAAPAKGDAATSTAGDKSAATELVQGADNPAYVILATQLESTKRELVQLAAQRDDLRAKQRTYDARLQQIPEVEREYSELTRDYSNAQTRYREIKAKQLQAEGAMELEKDSKAERFSLGEPAVRPQKPFSPDRPAIIVIGLVASLGSGLGLAFLREMFDRSIKGPQELARIARVPILTAIPYIETERERARRRRRTLLQLGACSALVVFLLAGVHYFMKPIPQIVASVMHKIAVW